jgi:hypothetical protein
LYNFINSALSIMVAPLPHRGRDLDKHLEMDADHSIFARQLGAQARHSSGPTNCRTPAAHHTFLSETWCLTIQVRFSHADSTRAQSQNACSARRT